MWTQQSVLRFIELFHATPALWDASTAEYRDKNKRVDAAQEIAREMGITLEEVWKKIKSLRSQFSRELGKKRSRSWNIKKSEPGTSSREVQWFAFEHLQFLQDSSNRFGDRTTCEPAFRSIGCDRECSSQYIVPPDVEERWVLSDVKEPSKLHREVSAVQSDLVETSDQTEATNDDDMFPCADDTGTGDESDEFSEPSHSGAAPFDKPPAAKRKRAASDDTLTDLIVTVRDSVKERKERDRHTVFGELIAMQMRDARRSSLAYTVAQTLIQEIVGRLHVGEYDNGFPATRYGDTQPQPVCKLECEDCD